MKVSPLLGLVLSVGLMTRGQIEVQQRHPGALNYLFSNIWERPWYTLQSVFYYSIIRKIKHLSQGFKRQEIYVTSVHLQQNILFICLDDVCNVYLSFIPTKIYHSNYDILMTAVHFKPPHASFRHNINIKSKTYSLLNKTIKCNTTLLTQALCLCDDI